MLTVIAFVVAIGILVVWHELGHYFAARVCGVPVLRFSFGFGPVLFRWKAKSSLTEWAFSVFPLGGYVAMLDQSHGTDQVFTSEQLARSLNRQPLIKRVLIVSAGPLANFLLAIMVYWVLAVIGTQEPAPVFDAAPKATLFYEAGFVEPIQVSVIDGVAVTSFSDASFRLTQAAIERKRVEVLGHSLDKGKDLINKGDARERLMVLDFSQLTSEQIQGSFLQVLGARLAAVLPQIDSVVTGSPAFRAGLVAGDVIINVGEVYRPNVATVVNAVRASANRPLQLAVWREGKVIDMHVIPTAQTGSLATIGVGFSPIAGVIVRYPPWEAAGVAIGKTWDISVLTVKMLGQIITGRASLSNLSGPLTIADAAGKTAAIGLISFLSFLALVSVGLGILNLLPIPMLDGGHLLYYGLEAVTGRVPSERLMTFGQIFGALILGLLMVIALTNDVVRLVIPQFSR
jgi:regulator of sigma E protease